MRRSLWEDELNLKKIEDNSITNSNTSRIRLKGLMKGIIPEDDNHNQKCNSKNSHELTE